MHINFNLVALFLLLGSVVLHAVWLSRLAALLESKEQDPDLVAGLNQLASSSDGGDGKTYRRAVAYVYGRKYARLGDRSIRTLGDRILLLTGATALMCLGAAVLQNP